MTITPFKDCFVGYLLKLLLVGSWFLQELVGLGLKFLENLKTPSSLPREYFQKLKFTNYRVKSYFLDQWFWV